MLSFSQRRRAPRKPNLAQSSWDSSKVDLKSLALFESPEKFQNLLQTYDKRLKTKFLQDRSLKSIFQIVLFIEKHQQSWISECETSNQSKFHFPRRKIRRNSQNPIQIELGNHCQRVLLDPSESIGKGSFKKADLVYDYPTWKPLARIQIKADTPSKIDLSEFKNESEILKTIFNAPADQKAGLVQSYYFDNDRFYQKFYEEGDLLKLPHIHSEFDHLQLASQLSLGVKNLHSLGYVHGDIKPENFFSLGKEWVLADFGFSYDPNALLTKDLEKPRSGTWLYSPPDQLQDWEGRWRYEKIENAEKADVFSLAMSLLIIQRSFPELYSCKQLDETCRMAAIKHVTKTLAKSKSPYLKLLARSLNLSPWDRPTSSEFHETVDQIIRNQIIKRFQNHWQYNAQEEGQHRKRNLCMPSLFRRTCHQQEITVSDMDFDDAVIAVLQTRGREKEQVLVPFKSEKYGRYSLVLIYWDEALDTVKTKILRSHPLAAHEIKEEIHSFLSQSSNKKEK